MAERLRLLLVEDDEVDAELTRLTLEDNGFELEWLRVDTAEAMRQALDEREWDAIVSDFAMPRFDGLSAFTIFLERRLDIPFIFVSGALGEERAVEAMRAGAHDYLLKGHLGRLAVAMRRELRASRNRRMKTTAEESARRHQRRLSLAVEASGVGIFEAHVPPDDATFVGERCAEMVGHRLLDLPEPEALPLWVMSRLHGDDVDPFLIEWTRFVAGQAPTLRAELRLRHQDGRWVDVEVRAKPYARDVDGRVTSLVGVVIDLTERKTLEMHARQAQKMEAVGRLAGGVAHDFNNLLTAIFSFGAFVLDGLDESHPVRGGMEEVMKAARRAAGLTNQLLAFSRLKKSSRRVIAVREVIVSIERMLGRLLGEDIDISVRLADGDPRVRMDPAELEQILVNLTVNARDAMPRGGKLTIETACQWLDETLTDQAGTRVKPGDYVTICVSDTGVGMDQTTLARIFEPFFTTKAPGSGTGLGLATCYGIVEHAGGFIWVYSEPGRGSTFKVYLPVTGEVDNEAERRIDPARLSGRGLVLVVEDDEQVRMLAVRTLERHGYTVVHAAHGDEALERQRALTEPIALLLTDVVMPGMSGRDLADKLMALRPDMRVLYMSGYAPGAVKHRGELAPGAFMLQKPFTPDMLAREVRAALDAPPPSVAHPGSQG